MSITLLKGDCLEKMKSIPDKSVDLIICDLPFGCLGPQKKGGGIPRVNTDGAFGGCSWDIKIDLEIFWKQIKRIRKNEHSPTLMFTTTKYGYELIKSNEREFRYDLVWDKGRGVSFLTVNKLPMRSHEMIYVFSKAGAKYNRIDIEGQFASWKSHEHKSFTNTVVEYSGINKANANDGTHRCMLSVINMKKPNTLGHPTEKTEELYKFLIRRYSDAGDVVLDPTFGSANSGFACKELNRNYIGIEKDEKFFWKATNRLLTVDGSNIQK
jgi:site-specific DNA-methyltransferase (adenine-specific)